MSTPVKALTPGDRYEAGVFGVAGVDAWDELQSRPDRLGLVRNVRVDHQNNDVSGVTYELEQAQIDPGFRWRKTSVGGRWEMDLGTSRDPRSLPEYTTLEHLAQRIHKRQKRSGQLPEGDDQLLMLNGVIDQLLKAASLLHSRKQIVGLLTPSNVVSFLDENRSLRVVLPDVGFCWRGNPPVPSWIHRLESQWSEFWYPLAGDAFQRRAWGKTEKEDAERADLKLIARLCLWVLSGSTKELDQTARQQLLHSATSDDVYAPCWQVLYRCLVSEKELRALSLAPIPNVAALQKELASAPLSEHFQHRPTKPRATFSSRGILVGLLLLLLVGGGGFLLLNPDLIKWLFPPTEPPSILCEECKYPSPLLPVLKQHEKKLRELQDLVKEIETEPNRVSEGLLMQTMDGLDNLSQLISEGRAAQSPDSRFVAADEECLAKWEQHRAQYLELLGPSYVAAASERRVVNEDVVGQRLMKLYDSIPVNLSKALTEKPEWYQQTAALFPL